MASTLALDDMPAINHDITFNNLSEAREELASLLVNDGIISDPTACFSRSSNAWAPAATTQKPEFIVLPNSTEDVSAIMRICSRRRIPVTAYAGGTSITGALISTRGGICIDFSRMNKIIDIHAEDMDVVVQPGVGWQDLNHILKQRELFFPPDPGPGARIGGMISTSCAGTNAYRYGTMKEWVIGLIVVLADGTVVKTKRRPRKSSAGYDLTHLIVGSEGTLGLVTEATLKLTALPTNIHVAIATFPDIRAGTRAAISLATSGHLLDALELLDHTSMKGINISRLSPRQWREEPTMFIKISGSSKVVEDLIATVEEAAHENNCTSFEATGDAHDIEVLWGGRKMDGKATLSMRKYPSDIFIPSDAAVPLSRTADFLEEAQRLIQQTGLSGGITSHLGDGNSHVKIICEASREAEGRAIISQLEHLAIQMDGTVSGEHGIGLKLRDELIEELGSSAVDMMRRIKLALDPLCLLNCDKVFAIERTK